MKEKILNALKTNYAKLGLGDKAFDGVASFLEKTITDENDIITRVKGDDVALLLKGIQGETDSLRTARTKAEKDLDDYRKAHPETPADEQEEKKDEQSDALKALMDEINALKARNAEMDKKAKRDSVISGIRSALKAANCGSEPILDLVLSNANIGDNDTVESLVDGFKSAYQEKYKVFYGNGAVPPYGSEKPNEPYKKGKFSGVVSGLEEMGAFPKDGK